MLPYVLTWTITLMEPETGRRWLTISGCEKDEMMPRFSTGALQLQAGLPPLNSSCIPHQSWVRNSLSHCFPHPAAISGHILGEDPLNHGLEIEAFWMVGSFNLGCRRSEGPNPWALTRQWLRAQSFLSCLQTLGDEVESRPNQVVQMNMLRFPEIFWYRSF